MIVLMIIGWIPIDFEKLQTVQTAHEFVWAKSFDMFQSDRSLWRCGATGRPPAATTWISRTGLCVATTTTTTEMFENISEKEESISLSSWIITSGPTEYCGRVWRACSHWHYGWGGSRQILNRQNLCPRPSSHFSEFSASVQSKKFSSFFAFCGFINAFNFTLYSILWKDSTSHTYSYLFMFLSCSWIMIISADTSDSRLLSPEAEFKVNI